MGGIKINWRYADYIAVTKDLEKVLGTMEWIFCNQYVMRINKLMVTFKNNNCKRGATSDRGIYLFGYQDHKRCLKTAGQSSV